ncbi:hypothetical protein AKJ44_00430 [candidate division MSBL1 archaeon SCGC-AAA261F17]|uniref:Uncharacterized protein n=1 Tax=candidate division MSBL1 archaeon SCGC-AAA261F17 TaxID=1698274 RepID=A0A133V7S0_9EURY|nr:hypothetical protein AKJ44_00430 [candidate division MSBL1 archaeon SCGC-AAA261F17]
MSSRSRKKYTPGEDEFIRENWRDMSDVAKAVEKSVSDLEVVIGKIKEALGNGKGGYLYVKTPDGIYDRELEEEFGKRIPQNPNPRRNTFFWSEPFSDFVVQDRFGKEVEAAIRARYGDGVRIVKNPEWASKENTWQIKAEKGATGGETAPISPASKPP